MCRRLRLLMSYTSGHTRHALVCVARLNALVRRVLYMPAFCLTLIHIVASGLMARRGMFLHFERRDEFFMNKRTGKRPGQ